MKKVIDYIENSPSRFLFFMRLAESFFFLVFLLLFMGRGQTFGDKLLLIGLLVSLFITFFWGVIYTGRSLDKTAAKVIVYIDIPLILILPFPALFGTTFYAVMPVLFLLTIPFLFDQKEVLGMALTFFIVFSLSSLFFGMPLPADKRLFNYASQTILFGMILGSMMAAIQSIRVLESTQADLEKEKKKLENKSFNLEKQLKVSRQHTEILNKDVRKRDIEIQNILTLSGQLKARNDARQVIQSFLLTAIGQIGSSHALLFSREKKEHHFLSVFIHRGLRGVDMARIRIYMDSNLIDILNAVREPILVSQIPREGLYEDEVKFLGLFSKDLLCPVFINGNLSALYIMGQKITRTGFTKEDINMVAIIANQTSFILEQTQMANDYREFYSKTMRAMLNSLETKYIYARGHNLRTANYVNLLSRKLGLSSSEVNDFSYGALLHDIGKVVVPDEYLLNSETFSSGDSLIKEKILEHAIEGSKILKSAGFNQTIIDMALHHHEFYNGKGFPDQMGKNEIPLGTKILSVCNAYDAMISDRPYRKALSTETAKGNLRHFAGIQFDPEIVNAFLSGLHLNGRNR